MEDQECRSDKWHHCKVIEQHVVELTTSNNSNNRSPIRDHTIFWGESISTTSELVISKKQGHVLGPCEFKLEVYQENARELIPIGNLVINLSEYAESGLTTRRYLLDDCKFNSTIKVNYYYYYYYYYYLLAAIYTSYLYIYIHIQLAIRMNRLSDTDIHFNV
jgi:hypothetical protein